MKSGNIPEQCRAERPLAKLNHSPSFARTAEFEGENTSADAVELICSVQHYDWGDRRFIPELLGEKNSTAFPYAELWIGAHPDAPSAAVLRTGIISLPQMIQTDPERVLHPAVAARFKAELPFLFKVLAAASPLSIQVHPGLLAARAGFDRENQAQVPLTANTRNYRDANHKPELIVALTDFYALRGFAEPSRIRQSLLDTPELQGLAERA